MLWGSHTATHNDLDKRENMDMRNQEPGQSQGDAQKSS